MIRPLRENEYELAVALRLKYWDEELPGVSPGHLNFDEELNFLKNWINRAEEDKDIRIVLGAFLNDVFVGFAGASIAEETDAKNAVELNYLFVTKEYRGQGISLKLIEKVTELFREKGYHTMIVYNHHLAASNTYYKKLGGKVIRKIEQDSDHIQVDIFSFDLQNLMRKIKRNETYDE